jgi:peptidyl-prolyl cis-trans isomerase C
MSTLKRSCAILLLLLLLLTACSGNPGGLTLPVISASPTPLPVTDTPQPPTATPVPLAATVNGEGLSLDEFNAELARYKTAQTALGNTVNDQEASKIVLDDLLGQMLLAQGAATAGFSMDETALQARIDNLTAQLGGVDKLSAWQQAHGYSEAGFRSALKRAAAAAWMRDKIISAVPSTAEQVHVRQILLYNEEVAKNIWNQLQAGAEFDETVARIDPVARGDIGWFPRGYLTEQAIEEAAFNLEVGKYSEVIKSAVGFHIIKVIERQADRPLAPDALFALQSRALEEWLANQRQQSNIVLTTQ